MLDWDVVYFLCNDKNFTTGFEISELAIYKASRSFFLYLLFFIIVQI